MKRRIYKGARKKSKYKQGLFNPLNPEKYKGNDKGIVYRSSWELKIFLWMDKDPNIIQWSSEEIVIPYKSIDGRYHRYFVDVWYKTVDGKEILVEIKPHKETIIPVRGKKREHTYLNECLTYEKNQAKWKFAREYCKKRGWEFVILTEKNFKFK